jgi:hypothetical protein
MNPSLDAVAPMIRAMSRATLGFSAMQTIIFSEVKGVKGSGVSL